jgi:hypothetical protein
MLRRLLRPLRITTETAATETAAEITAETAVEAITEGDL